VITQFKTWSKHELPRILQLLPLGFPALIGVELNLASSAEWVPICVTQQIRKAISGVRKQPDTIEPIFITLKASSHESALPFRTFLFLRYLISCQNKALSEDVHYTCYEGFGKPPSHNHYAKILRNVCIAILPTLHSRAPNQAFLSPRAPHRFPTPVRFSHRAIAPNRALREVKKDQRINLDRIICCLRDTCCYPCRRGRSSDAKTTTQPGVQPVTDDIKRPDSRMGNFGS
jgi:hypothetical protein